jgi:hypothetical protein
MSDKAKDEDFVPVMVVGLYKGNPAVRTLECEEGVSSTQVAGFMTAMLDCIVDTVDEHEQTQFEEEILEAFEVFVTNRFENTNKYKIEEDE